MSIFTDKHCRPQRKKRGKLARGNSAWGNRVLHFAGGSLDLSALPPEVNDAIDDFASLVKGGKNADKFRKGTAALVKDIQKFSPLKFARWTKHMASVAKQARMLRYIDSSKGFLSRHEYKLKVFGWSLTGALALNESYHQNDLRPAVRELTATGITALARRFLLPRLTRILARGVTLPVNMSVFIASIIVYTIASEILDNLLPDNIIHWNKPMNVEFIRNQGQTSGNPNENEIRFEKWADSRFENYEITGFSGSESFSGGFLFSVSLKYNPQGNKRSEFRKLDIQSLVGQHISWGIQKGPLDLLDRVRPDGALAERFEFPGVRTHYHYPAKSIASVRWFHGQIQAVSRREGGRLTLLVGSFLDTLALHVESNVYRNKTVVGIAREILDRVLPGKKVRSKPWEIDCRLKEENYRKREQTIQYRESTLDFLERLFEEEGIWYYFKHEPDRYVLVIGDTMEGLEGNIGDFAVLDGETTSELSGRVAITAFEHAAKEAAEVRMFQYFDPTSTRCLSNNSIYNCYSDGACEETYYPELDDKDDVAWEDARLSQEQAWQSLLCQGSGNCFMFSLTDLIIPVSRDQWDAKVGKIFYPGVRPDIKITHSQTEKFRVMAIEHNVYKNLYFHSFDALPKRHSEQPQWPGCKPAKAVEFRPARQVPKPRIDGIQVGVVAMGQDKPAWPPRNTSDKDEFTPGPPVMDEKGRIPVQFPWLYKADEKPLTVWARLSQPWSGAGHGTRFVPHAGQEVFVSFIDGDPDLPVILACGASSTAALPFDEHCTGIRFPSGDAKKPKEGAAILYDSGKDEQTLMIRSPELQTDVVGNCFQTVGGETVICTEGGITIQAGSSSLQMTDGKICLEIGGNGIEISKSGVWVDGKEVHLNAPGHAPKTGEAAKRQEKTQAKSKK